MLDALVSCMTLPATKPRFSLIPNWTEETYTSLQVMPTYTRFTICLHVRLIRGGWSDELRFKICTTLPPSSLVTHGTSILVLNLHNFHNRTEGAIVLTTKKKQIYGKQCKLCSRRELWYIVECDHAISCGPCFGATVFAVIPAQSFPTVLPISPIRLTQVCNVLGTFSNDD